MGERHSSIRGLFAVTASGGNRAPTHQCGSRRSLICSALGFRIGRPHRKHDRGPGRACATPMAGSTVCGFGPPAVRSESLMALGGANVHTGGCRSGWASTRESRNGSSDRPPHCAQIPPGLKGRAVARTQAVLGSCRPEHADRLASARHRATAAATRLGVPRPSAIAPPTSLAAARRRGRSPVRPARAPRVPQRRTRFAGWPGR
jgi:hypothetical protein